MLFRIALFSKYANYFEVNQAISELIRDGRVICELTDTDELLMLTADAMFRTAEIEKTLPRSVREKAVSAALKIFARDRAEEETTVEVDELEHGFNVSFIIKDVGTELMRLTIYVSESSQIELVKRNFYNNAAGIYSDIISSLTVE